MIRVGVRKGRDIVIPAIRIIGLTGRALEARADDIIDGEAATKHIKLGYWGGALTFRHGVGECFIDSNKLVKVMEAVRGYLLSKNEVPHGRI